MTLHAALREYQGLRDANLFLDISPLMEIAWTGIANVTANLARELHRQCPNNSYFFYRDKIVEPTAVLTAIEVSPGDYLGTILANGYADLGHINDYIGRRPRSIGLFPNVKPFHRLFDVELLVLHDLSAMLMPELHEPWAARLHTRAMLLDVNSSDLVCCISEATRQDAITYLGVAPEKTFVSHLGAQSADLFDDTPQPRQDFALVIGTVEPRKNLKLIAEYLLSRPDLSPRLAMVFVGRRGWGASFDQIFGPLLQEQAWRDRIIFTDYIDEADKWALMRSARFAMFPSLFEGFGLPVAECMAAGCPVITSRTSSLVEFELPQEMYFDPMSMADFSKTFRYIDSMAEPQREQLGLRLKKQAQKYTWDACFKNILSALTSLPPAIADMPLAESHRQNDA